MTEEVQPKPAPVDAMEEVIRAQALRRNPFAVVIYRASRGMSRQKKEQVILSMVAQLVDLGKAIAEVVKEGEE